MNKIKFNETYEFEIDSYSKNVNFDGQNITKNAYCNMIHTDASEVEELGDLTITEIQIDHDGTLIYDLSDITAHVDNLSEYLNNDHMNVSVNLTFDI